MSIAERNMCLALAGRRESRRAYITTCAGRLGIRAPERPGFRIEEHLRTRLPGHRYKGACHRGGIRIYQNRAPPRGGVMVNATFEAGTPGLTKPASLPRWLVLLQGIVALALGILFLAYPVGTLVVLIVFLGIYWLVNGIFVLASLYSDRSDWGWKMFVGILGILGGILVLAYPLYSTILLPTLLAIIIGLILIANPFIAALALILVLAVLAIIGGIAAIIFALRMPA